MRLSGIFVILLTIGAVAQNQPAGTSQAFQGTYERLKPQQKLLIDDWYADYNKMMHEDLPPSDYNQLSLSTRTTFEAITHALMTTKLTGKSGQPMGNALELVQSIETINGKVPQARGIAVSHVCHVEAGCLADAERLDRVLSRPRQYRLSPRLPGELSPGWQRSYYSNLDVEGRTPCRHRRRLPLVEISSSLDERPPQRGELRCTGRQ